MNTAKQIAELNDQLRMNITNANLGKAVITSGVRSLLQESDDFGMIELIEALATYDDFTEDNDPYGEHDFGVVMVGGEKLIGRLIISRMPNVFSAQPIRMTRSNPIGCSR